MDDNQQRTLHYNPSDWAHDLDELRQNSLMSESTLITFARDRGLPVWGVVTGDPGAFHQHGWLRSDGSDHDAQPLFHPFRIYPLHKTLEACALHITRSASLRRGAAAEFFAGMLAEVPFDVTITRDAARWNDIVDLAILLEPLYWPGIVGKARIPIRLNQDAVQARFAEYADKVFRFLKTLDSQCWRGTHEQLRRDAAAIDDNPELYVLLRVSMWDQREKLKGALSAALWLRHIAEVLRRGFEEAHGEQWPEEYESYGEWFATGRELTFGSGRPLDDALRTGPYAAYNFGLFTGSAVRWYVEGETEYYAVLALLPQPGRFGIELVNLRGVLAAERDNIALKLGDWLREDQALRRFSIISFDLDVSANSKAIQQQVKQANVVGHIAAHKPDFETANFTIPELVEIAATLDEAHGSPANDLRSADWGTVSTGRGFEAQYRRLSLQGRGSLKGEAWGRALAEHALRHPERADTGTERPLVRTFRIAVHSRMTHYDLEKEYFGFDPGSFERVRRKPYPPYIAGA